MGAGDELVVVCEGSTVGIVRRAGSRLSFLYDEAWRDGDDPTPLSLSMPLVAREHRHRVVDAFMWGLLPDNEAVLERWGREFGVSVSHPFGLIANVGEDLPGAMQFLPQERPADRPEAGGDIEWLDTGAVADLLRTVRRDHTAWLGRRAEGRWSLAGAQPKIALFRDERGRWGRPSGRAATTHILKPAVVGFDDHDLNEHLCLRAAASLGLRVVRTFVESFEDERAVVVERYDRLSVGGGELRRVHQEDLCQALGVHPARKYQSDGGPSAAAVADLLRATESPDAADRDVAAFVEALVFNWLVAAPDAHAKNYAILLAGGQVRLAPLYDIGSVLAYEELHAPKVKLAMKIGGYYQHSAIGASAWSRFARELRVDDDWLRHRIRGQMEGVADAFADAAAAVSEIESPLPGRLVDAVAKQASRCARAVG